MVSAAEKMPSEPMYRATAGSFVTSSTYSASPVVPPLISRPITAAAAATDISARWRLRSPPPAPSIVDGDHASAAAAC
jgi:hypothetical protein